MEESGEQCTVVFAYNVTEPASVKGGGGSYPLPPTHSLTSSIHAKTTMHCSPVSSVDIVNAPSLSINFLVCGSCSYNETSLGPRVTAYFRSLDSGHIARYQNPQEPIVKTKYLEWER
jgi:hypothetical protein